MTEPLIPASAIEAAARHLPRDKASEYAEKALRAAFEELGMEMDTRWNGGDPRIKEQYRLRSRWMPVEESQ